MSDSYDDYESKMQLAEHAWEIKEARHTFRKNRIKENKMSREAMQMALDMLNEIADDVYCDQKLEGVITTLRQALEEKQEPVRDDRVMTVVYRNVQKEDAQSFMDHPKAVWFGWCHAPYERDDARFKLEKAITSPPASKPWVGLTADEIWKCNKAKSGSAVEFHICYEHQNLEDFAESIEAKLKEKNT